MVIANHTSGQKNKPRSTSAQILYSVHHNELQWVIVNYCAVKYCQLLWNTVDEKLSLNLSHVFNDLMICSVAGFRQSSTPRHDAVKLFFWRCWAREGRTSFRTKGNSGDALRNTQRYDLLQRQSSSFQQFFSHHIQAWVVCVLTDPLFLAPRCYGHTAALAFLYLLCPLPVTKLGFYFSDRWHILSSFRGKSLWNYFIAFLVPNQR